MLKYVNKIKYVTIIYKKKYSICLKMPLLYILCAKN